MLKWPSRSEVLRDLGAWAAQQKTARPDLRRIGCFGSLAHGAWGVGSDIDLVAVVTGSARPQRERPLDWDLSGLPLPADLLVYTEEEWRGVLARGDRFAAEMGRVLWLAE